MGITHAPGKTIFLIPDDFTTDGIGPFAVVETGEDGMRAMKKRLNQLKYDKVKIGLTAPGASPVRPAFLLQNVSFRDALSLASSSAAKRILWIENGLIAALNCADGSPQSLEGCADNFVRVGNRPSHCIYVVRFSRDVLVSKEFLEANPDAEQAKDLLYVGLTGTSWEERFAQHKRGYKASRLVRKHGVEVVRELCLGYMPYKEAELREVEYAAELRSAGYAVWQK